MAEYVRHYPKRTLVSYDDFIGSANDYVLLCVNSAVLGLIRQLVKERGLWKTTYYKTIRQEDYEIPTDAEFDQVDELVSEFLEESATMSLCQDLITTLEDVAVAIRQTACCGPNSAGLQEIGGEVYFGSEEPLEEPTSFGGGEEFATEEAYLSHKCEAANAIAYGLIYSLNSIGATELVSFTLASAVLGAAVGFGLFNPPAALLFALLAAGLALTALYQVANAISDNREDLVCILYSSDTAIDAYDDVKDFVETLAVDLGFIEVEIGAIADVIMSMAPIDTMNKLYQSVGFPPIPEGEIDCDGCEGCQPAVLYGAGPVSTGGTFYSEYISGANVHLIVFRLAENKQLTFSSLTGWTLQGGSNNDFRVGNAPAAPNCSLNDKAIYDSDTPISGTYCGGFVTIESSTPFSINVAYGSSC